MPDLGHVCVGMFAGRLYRGEDRLSLRDAVAFSALSLLPDIDMVGRAAGFADNTALGHRGAAHSLLLAVVVGAFFWKNRRLALFAFLTVASHGFFDMMDRGALGVQYLWPFSTANYFLPLRFLPGPPPGEHWASWDGVVRVATSTAYFLPLAIAALWRKSDERLVPSDA